MAGKVMVLLEVLVAVMVLFVVDLVLIAAMEIVCVRVYIAVGDGVGSSALSLWC